MRFPPWQDVNFYPGEFVKEVGKIATKKGGEALKSVGQTIEAGTQTAVNHAPKSVQQAIEPQLQKLFKKIGLGKTNVNKKIR